MAIRSAGTQRMKDYCWWYTSMFLRGIIEPSAFVIEAKQRRRLRLLSIFLLIIAIWTIIGMLAMMASGNSLWSIMAATGTALIILYGLSRTRFYWLAIVPAVIIPAVPSFSGIFFGNGDYNVTSSMMWLALPLLVSGVLLSLRHTIIVAISYNIAIAFLILLAGLPPYSLIQILPFISIMSMIVIAIAAVRQQDQSEIERQLTERMAAEEALREREKRFSDIAENALEWIWEVDTKGKYTYSSPVVEEILGYKPEEILGKYFYDFFHPEDKEEMKKAAFEAFSQKQPFHEFVNRNVKRNGDIIILSTSGVPVIDEAGNLIGYRGVDTDITERKRAEEALRESEVKFSTAFSASPDIVSIVNLENHKFIEVNDSFTRYTGYTREEVIGHTSDEVGIWAKAEERDKIRSMQEEKGSASNEEIHTLTKTGDIRVGLFSAETINIGGEMCSIAVIADITERKKREQLQNDENYVLTLLGQGAELGQIMEAIVRLGESHDPSVKGSVLLFDSSRGWLDPVSAPSLPDDYNGLLKDGIPIGPTMGSCGTAAYRKERVIIPDIKRSPLFKQHKDVVKCTAKNNMLACWSQPIIASNGDLLGTIANYSNKVGEPDADDIIVLEWSARIAAIAIERKRAEEALRESEEKFSKAFRTSPNTMAITTLKDGKFIDINDSHTRITGYTREETIGHRAVELGLWASAEERTRMIQILEEQGSVQNEEFIFRMKNGEIRNWLFSAEPINIGGEKCLISVTTDITERKRAEEALADEATRRRILIEQSRDGIVVLDLEGHVYESNQRFADMLGYSIEEVHQLNVFDWEYLYPPEQVVEMIRTVDEAGDNFETRHRRKDGSTYDVEISTNGAWFAGQKLIFCVCRDITERKQAEEALRESEEKFSKAFRLSPDMVTINTLGKDGIFIDVSDSFIRTTGYSREEVIGRSSIELGIWASKEDNDRILQILTKHGRVRNEEYAMRMKSGETRVWLFSVEPIKIGGEECVICVNTDITERKRAEEKLRESEEKFSKAFRSSPDAIAITTLKDGKFIEVNDSYTRINGYTREEVIGHSSSEFGVWAKKEERNKIIRTLKEKGRVSNEEVHLYAKSGKTMICLFSAELINIGGEPCMISLATDITRRKQAEGELKQALTNLEHFSAQLAATNKELEAFSYSVSHDLRSPLRSIDGFSQALLEDYMDKLDEDGRDYLSRLRGASQKMGELIDGLLNLSRLTRSEMRREKVDLSALAKEITARLKETQPERRVDFVISRGLTVSGDRQLLRVLMENLLGNAWKFTSKREQAKIEFGATQNGDKKAYFIKDNGAGFDMAYANRLFSAFQRLHETTEFPGTGIGLATVQRIINRHGGSVWAEGAAEKGATFYFTLN